MKKLLVTIIIIETLLLIYGTGSIKEAIQQNAYDKMRDMRYNQLFSEHEQLKRDCRN